MWSYYGSKSKVVEKFLDAAYCGGETESNVIALLERCESQIEEVINKEVEVVD